MRIQPWKWPVNGVILSSSAVNIVSDELRTTQHFANFIGPSNPAIMKFIASLLFLCLCLGVQAQDCKVKIKKFRSGGDNLEFALPEKEGDKAVLAQGDSWVEIMDKEGYRKRIPKINLEIYRDNFFEAEKVDPESLRGKTRGQLIDEQAERKYRDYLTNYHCGEEEAPLEPFNIFVEGEVVGLKGKPLKEYSYILVFRDGKQVDSVSVADNGRFGFSLDRHMYTASFHADGFVSKKLMFDGREIPEEEANQGFTVYVEMSLFEPEKGVNYTIFEETPIGLAEYDERGNSFEFDRTYSRQIRNLIDHLEPSN